MNTPISLYIPARNAEATLGECIAAARQTRAANDFFILVDPRSTDATVAVARASGVRVVEQTGPTLGSARNQAITAAKHRWVASCDSDVIVRPDWLERLSVRRAENHAGIGARTLERVRNPFDAWRAVHMPHHWGEYSFRNPFMLVSEVLFDRDALLSVGGYRDDLNYYEDSDLCQRLREGGYDLIYEPSAVAEHRRTDTLAGLLSLRWRYSEYRQLHLLDRFAGLLQKCRVNREYALNTLARCLAGSREELAYISYLVFFHHLLMDFRSMLSRRPMIDIEDRARLERELLETSVDPVGRTDPAVAEWIRADLGPLCTPGPSGPARHFPPVWSAHLAAVNTTVEQFQKELPDTVRGVIRDSALHCHDRLDAQEVMRLPTPSIESLQALVESVPLHPLVTPGFLQSVHEQWPEARGARLIGPCAEGEQAIVETLHSREPGDAAVIAAHLEGLARPLSVLDGVAGEIGRLVLCYQPLDRLIPGLDLLTPADLASAAARAGWTIDRFDTLVGRIRLMLSR